MSKSRKSTARPPTALSPVQAKHRRPRGKANGEGSIYEYRGRWRGALTWTDGKRKVVSGDSYDAVRKALDTLRVARDKGKPMPTTLTVGSFLTEWLDRTRDNGVVRPATWRQYENVCRVYVTPALGNIALAKLEPRHVEAMTGAMVRNGRAPRTAALTRVVLGLALADAQRNRLIEGNAARDARPPHVPSRSLVAGRDYLDPTDLRRLIVAAKVHQLGPLSVLAAGSGLRLGELLGLTWADIDTSAATLTVRRALARSWDDKWTLAEPKTERSRRTVHLPVFAVAALDRQRALQDAARDAAGRAWQDRLGLVFTTPIGTPLDGSNVNHVWHELLDTAGLPSIPFHGLRHSCATSMLAGGTPLLAVSRALGHSTVTVTADRYAGIVPETLREAADGLDRALG